MSSIRSKVIILESTRSGVQEPLKHDLHKFWAYLHENGNIHIKKWFPPINRIDDRQHAEQEMIEGNSFILWVSPTLIEAPDHTSARYQAYQMWLSSGRISKRSVHLPLDKFNIEE